MGEEASSLGGQSKAEAELLLSSASLMFWAMQMFPVTRKVFFFEKKIALFYDPVVD